MSAPSSGSFNQFLKDWCSLFVSNRPLHAKVLARSHGELSEEEAESILRELKLWQTAKESK